MDEEVEAKEEVALISIEVTMSDPVRIGIHTSVDVAWTNYWIDQAKKILVEGTTQEEVA